MALSRTGRVMCMAAGTLPYLEMLGRRSRVRGRKWIELNTAPARLLALAVPLPILATPVAAVDSVGRTDHEVTKVES